MFCIIELHKAELTFIS
uniref:Uncharacterized protein n=1 Tax=Anguilla anguilla TaxID=7936 RepID=A0A0E9SN06_ANGAN